MTRLESSVFLDVAQQMFPIGPYPYAWINIGSANWPNYSGFSTVKIIVLLLTPVSRATKPLLVLFCDFDNAQFRCFCGHYKLLA